MAIELLDLRKNWAKIKAGFGGGNLFRNPPKQPHHPYANGPIQDVQNQAQGIAAQPSNAFTGKTFSARMPK